MSGFRPTMDDVEHADREFGGSLYNHSHTAQVVRDWCEEQFGWDSEQTEYIDSDVAFAFAQLCSVALRTRASDEQRGLLRSIGIRVSDGSGSTNESTLSRHQHNNWFVDPSTPKEAVCWSAQCMDCDEKLMLTAASDRKPTY